MKTVIVYKEETDYARDVSDYLRDFMRQTGHELETLDPDTPEGADFCRAYDIVEYPSVVAISDNGNLQNLWRGLPLPTISEVSYYV
ncbi:MAG: hypothetical protein HZB75_04185 [Candidatus Saccharibacteria bacterium]|jgi:hypothetical protein|nr:MAG: hypothetical protein HZB75_04185 [Candidatus Saccharibacteria bacterium]